MSSKLLEKPIGAMFLCCPTLFPRSLPPPPTETHGVMGFRAFLFGNSCNPLLLAILHQGKHKASYSPQTSCDEGASLGALKGSPILPSLIYVSRQMLLYEFIGAKCIPLQKDDSLR